jgi:hypothetical protein
MKVMHGVNVDKHNSQVIADNFNTYFLTVAQHIHTGDFNNSNSGVS